MRSDSRSQASRAERVRVWDVPTRAFHWTLVALILSAWVSFQYGDKLGDLNLTWHRWNGIAILVLIVWRVLWGFAGSSTARFVNFVRWPWTAAGYGLDLLRGRPRHFLGHNPLGSYMVLALLALVALQAGLGLFTLEHNDTVAGPLKRIASDGWVKTASWWHRRGLNILLVFIGLHISANLFYQFVKKEPLITGMVTGSKPSGHYEDEAEADIPAHAVRRALLCLVVAAAIVLGGILALGGRLW